MSAKHFGFDASGVIFAHLAKVVGKALLGVLRSGDGLACPLGGDCLLGWFFARGSTLNDIVEFGFFVPFGFVSGVCGERAELGAFCDCSGVVFGLEVAALSPIGKPIGRASAGEPTVVCEPCVAGGFAFLCCSGVCPAADALLGGGGEFLDAGADGTEDGVAHLHERECEEER